MDDNKVIELLKITVLIEIANDCVIKDDCIEIALPNGEVAILTAIQTDKNIYEGSAVVRENDYVFNHDYGDIGENRANKLLLRNLQDVMDYAVDVVQTNIIDVAVVNDMVKIASDPILKIVVKSQN